MPNQPPDPTSPLTDLLATGDEEPCLHHILAFVRGDPELSAALDGTVAAMPGWLPGLLGYALGARASTLDAHAVRACRALRDEPDLEARFANYVTGTLRLHQVPGSTVTDLRTALLAAIRQVPHQQRRSA